MDTPDPCNGKTVVYYDGSCPMCRAEIGIYRRQDKDGQLKLVDVSLSNPLPPSLDRAGAMARFHVMAGDGQLLSGAAAFAEVWRRLPGWRWASRIASLPGVITAFEFAYRMFLPARPALVRTFLAAQRLTARR